MRKLSMLKVVMATLVLSASAAVAQDVGINIISQENSVNDGEWAKDAPEGTVTILVTICNNSGGSTNVPSYKLRPLISVPSAIVKVAPAGKQTGLPAGWTILTLTDGSIRLSNGTDQLPPAECREFPIYLEPVAEGGPLTVTSTLSFSNGNAPGSAVGPQTVGNNPANDNSTTTVKIIAPLPVTLVSFTAVKESSISQLSWATTEETNSDRFEIERSTNGKNWNKIGSVASNGESNVLHNYKYTDKTPINGENLYRLKMIDNDATFAYSSIRSVRFEGLANSVVSAYVYPNPSTERVFLKTADLSGVSQVSVLDLNGRIVLTTKVVAEGISVRSLSTGAYILKVFNADGSTSVHKFLISR